VYRVQATVIDGSGNVWMASYGNSRVVVYPGGDPGSSIFYQGDADTFTPFGIAVADDGTVWVTNSNKTASGIVNFRINGKTVERLRETTIGKVMKGIVIDSLGNIWAASGGDAHVYLFDRDGMLLGGYQGGGLDGPWGITLDGDDNLWAGDFGPLAVGNVFHGRLTQLASANGKTRPAGYRTGDAISPQTGYTLPSAGEQVRLHDGSPLYGAGSAPCFIPMMRTTGLEIDAAGNVWTCNNWKPDFDMDLFGDPLNGEAANPGGDGMVIFVGLARPPRR
jgi:sugar lactone lactonase YvrE